MSPSSFCRCSWPNLLRLTPRLYESGQEWTVCACHWPQLCSPAVFNQYTHPEYDMFILNKPACVIITHWCVQRSLRGCVNTFLQHSVTTKMDISARKWPPTFQFSIQSLPHIHTVVNVQLRMYHSPPSIPKPEIHDKSYNYYSCIYAVVVVTL